MNIIHHLFIYSQSGEEESTNEEFHQSINKGLQSLNHGSDESDEREKLDSLIYKISVTNFFEKEFPYLNCDGDLVLEVDTDGNEVVVENFEESLKLLNVNELNELMRNDAKSKENPGS